MEEKRKGKIAVLTSGGDAPGMNAAIRAVVRTAIYNDIEVIGVNKGYQGLLTGDIEKLTPRSVSDIIDRGGTILKTARCKEMMTEEGQQKAANVCKVLGIDTLVVIGGDGSLTGGLKLSALGVNIIGIPGTIDLDLACSEYTIGFDTAVNTAMEAVNKIRDTSGSHQRCSVVEVMGRNAGYLALWCGITSGAEEVIIPEEGKTSTEDIVKTVIENRAKGKKHNLIIVAEGIGGSIELAKEIEALTGIESRATILGHLQRGGSPTALDRLHASMMGNYAVQLVLQGKRNQICIIKDGKYDSIDLEEGLQIKAEYDETMHDVMKILSI